MAESDSTGGAVAALTRVGLGFVFLSCNISGSDLEVSRGVACGGRARGQQLLFLELTGGLGEGYPGESGGTRHLLCCAGAITSFLIHS